MTSLLAVVYAAGVILLGRAALIRGDPAVAAQLLMAPHGPPTPPQDLLSLLGRPLERVGGRTAEHLRVLGQDALLPRVLGTKALLCAAGLAAGGLLAGVGPGAAIAGAALGAGGWVLPTMTLGRRVAARSHRAASAVPDVLDLVSLAVGAGLSARLALDRATSLIEGPLGEELRRAGSAVALGVPWEAALRSVAERTGAPAMHRLAVTLSRGKRLGTPLAGPLRRLALEVRAEHRARAEEAARRAPVAMLFPLVLCILPAFVVAAVVPAVLVAIRGLS